MKKRLLVVIIMAAMLMAFTMDAYSANTRIIPGKSVGDFQLDTPIANVIRVLGKPGKIMNSPAFKDVEYYYYYSKYRLIFAVLKDTKRVVEIAVYSSAYSTEDGIKKGCSLTLVEQIYGKGGHRQQFGDALCIFYPQGGINFAIKNNKVKVIAIRGNNYNRTEIIVP